jgi:hypothetical protein
MKSYQETPIMGFSASHGICVEAPFYKLPVGQTAKFITDVKCKHDKFHRDSRTGMNTDV